MNEHNPTSGGNRSTSKPSSIINFNRRSGSAMSLDNKVITTSKNNLTAIIKSALDVATQNQQLPKFEDHSNATSRKCSETTQHADPFSKFVTAQETYYTLAFKDAQLEVQYSKYFAKRSRNEFRSVICMISLLILICYVISFVTSPSSSQVWQRNYSLRTIPVEDMLSNYNQFCPAGYYCKECDARLYCGVYNLGIDIGFLILALFPGLLALFTSHYMSKMIFKQWHHAISLLVILFWVSCGIIIRQTVLEPRRSDYYTGMLTIALTLCTSLGLQIRYIYAVVLYTVLLIIWILCVSLRPLYPLSHVFLETGITTLALTGSFCVLTFSMFRSEKFYREQFLRGIFASKINTKLIGQLKSLQKTFTSGALDIESPLEKSLSIIRALMADSTINVFQAQQLELVAKLLNNPQLFTPDIEGQLFNSESEGLSQHQLSTGPSIDSEQRAWLMTEIVKKKGELKRDQSVATTKKRRKSVLPSSPSPSEKILHGMPEVPTLPKSSSKKSISALMANRPLTGTSDIENISEESEFTVSVHNRDPFSYASTRIMRANIEESDVTISEVLSNNMLNSMMQIARPLRSKKQPSHNPSQIQNMLAQLNTWNFKIFDFAEACPGGKPLFVMMWHLFETNELFEEFNIPLDKFNNYIWTIQEDHNATHAADVLHAVNYFASKDEVTSLLAPLELVALFLAAGVHDYDHPGLNNNFLITTKNPLALLYNDKAVLESYHAASAFQLMLKPENNFMTALPQSQWQAFREIVIEMILATDLSQHYATLTQFKTRLQSGFNTEIKEDRLLLFKMLIKCADVSNPTKEFGLYNKWTNAVLEEWRTQGDMEKKLNIPVSPFMDRENPNVLISSQTGFIDFIIVPMYEAIHTGFMPIPEPMEELEKNKLYWLKLKDEEKAKFEQVSPSERASRMSLRPSKMAPALRYDDSSPERQ